MSESTWNADDFYAKAQKPGAPAAPATAQPSQAEDFYSKANKITPETGKAVQPTPPTTTPPTTASAPAPAATSPEAAAVVADLAKLGVTNPEGSALSPEAFVKLHDSVLKSHFAAQDAEIAGWEAEARKLPPAEIAAAETFAREHLDADVRGVLVSSGLGSHPAVVKLAARLSAKLSSRG